MQVRVPADAVVWVEGTATSLGGTDRLYFSPPLPENRDYTYEIKARWKQGGQDVEKTLQVKVRRNETTPVDFSDLQAPRDSQVTAP
jgi:uncharacterized protein (TIGR03000 family)